MGRNRPLVGTVERVFPSARGSRPGLNRTASPRLAAPAAKVFGERTGRRLAFAGRTRISLLVLLTLLGFSTAHVVPSSGALGQAVHPEQAATSTGCDVPPRTFEDIIRLIRVGRSADDVAVTPSESAPILRATLADVRAVLLQFVACSGAGEPLRVWSLYSDTYLSRLLSRERGYDRARYVRDAEPHPIAVPDWPQLTVPDRAWVDSSGRSVVDATIHYPNLDRTKHLRFWFIWQDGRLRIDEVDGEITFAVP